MLLSMLANICTTYVNMPKKSILFVKLIFHLLMYFRILILIYIYEIRAQNVVLQNVNPTRICIYQYKIARRVLCACVVGNSCNISMSWEEYEYLFCVCCVFICKARKLEICDGILYNEIHTKMEL